MEKDLSLTILSFGMSGQERTIVRLAGMMWLRNGLIYRMIKKEGWK